MLMKTQSNSSTKYYRVDTYFVSIALLFRAGGKRHSPIGFSLIIFFLAEANLSFIKLHALKGVAIIFNQLKSAAFNRNNTCFHIVEQRRATQNLCP